MTSDLHELATRPASAHEPGPGRLRLVRLRLTLALIAAALLPLAVIAPVLRIVGNDTGASETARLNGVAGHVAAAVSVEIETARRVLLPHLDEAAAAIADPEAGAATFAKRLAAGRSASPSVLAAQLVALDGTVLASAPAEEPPGTVALSPAAFERLAAGRPVNLPPSRANPEVVTVLHAVVAGDAVVGAIRIDRSLDRLIDAVAAGPWPAGRTIDVIDATGQRRSRTDAPPDVSALSGEVVGRAIDPANGLTGRGTAPLVVPGLEGWAIAVSEPLVVSSMPVEPLVMLVVAILALVVLMSWMARQVLRPAAELEASSGRLRELYELERAASLRDALTGLGNHRAFHDELSRQFDQSNRYHVPLALLTLDLDEFKQVNDSMGHGVGDNLLAEVGRIIRETVRAADRAFRTGGDEFAIVLPHTDAAGAHDLGQRLLRRMLEDRASGDYRRPISFSAGVAAAPQHAVDRTALLVRADAALYRSKRHGRTMVTVFDASLDRAGLDERSRAELSSRVAGVAASRALLPAYQVIVHLETGRPIGYEGLVRPAPESGFESATELFGAAEMAGRTVDLDRACLEVVVAGARSVPDGAYISLNISPRTFEAPEFSAAAFLTILKRHGIEPGRVILELTEREGIQDLERLRGALEECRRAGVQIAADDVGAGNAGIRLLSQIQFDVMKIDLSLVQASAGREPVTSVLRSLVELASRWRALVIAEGVETAEQLRMIRGLGIPAAQGYLLGRPGPLDGRTTFDIEQLSTPEVGWWNRTAEVGGLARP